MSDEGEGAPERPAPDRWIPGRRLLPLASVGLPLAALDGGTGLGVTAALALDAVLLLGAALEGRSLPVPRVSRETERRLIVGVPNEVTVRVHNPHERAVRVDLRDDLPAGWEADPAELSVTVPPFARRELRYSVVPPRRGSFSFGDLHLRLEGRAKLGARLVTVEQEQEAQVFPNVLGPRRYELAARLGDLSHVGIRRVRQSGGGGEFDQLREYVAGDPFRGLDWKSSAKRQRPITRVFEQERSQTVLLAIDTGRMMATRLGSLTKLDHAINAALLLAWVALRRGDRVGLIVFADQVVRFLPPAAGRGQYRKVLDVLFAAEAEETYVDFRRLVEFVRARLRKRALLLIFSDLLDDAHAAPLAKHISLLSRTHLPVCVSMHDPVAERLADASVSSDGEAYRRVAAADLLGDRAALRRRLRKRGVQVVEAGPGELSIAAVNRYLEIKARRAL